MTTVAFQIEGQNFTALNGGPHFKITPAISFFVGCRTQTELDSYWKNLTSGGGHEVECGWLKDQFCVSWQIVPEILGDLMSSKDSARSERVMEALLKMVKLDIKKLKQTANRRA